VLESLHHRVDIFGLRVLPHGLSSLYRIWEVSEMGASFSVTKSSCILTGYGPIGRCFQLIHEVLSSNYHKVRTYVGWTS
jgi:hypothetical protein